MELVHDAPEQSLLREVEIIRNCMKKLNKFISKCDNQVIIICSSNCYY